MFDIFNKGVVVVAAIYLAMTIISIFLNAAHEATFVGQKFNVPKILLRVALGFALIIPSSTTGYSLMQDIFMKIVVQGAGLADKTWDAALNYLEYGGTLFIPPSTLSTTTDIVSKAITDKTYGGSTNEKVLSPVTQIFQDEVCMYASSQIWEKQVKAQTGKTPSPLETSSYYHPNFDVATGTVYFPGVGDSGSTPASSTAPIPQACGSAISYYQQNANTIRDQVTSADLTQQGADPQSQSFSNEVTSELLQMQNYSFSALKQLTLSLLPAAEEFVNKEMPGQDDFTPNASSDTSYINNNSKTMFAGLLAYSNLITPLQNLLSAAQNFQGVNNQSGVIPTMEAQGWIMAGSVYWTVESMNKKSDALSIGGLFPAVNTPASSVFNAHSAILSQAGREAYRDYAPVINTLWGQYVGAEQNNVAVNNGTATSDNAGMASSIAGGLSSKLSANSLMGVSSTSYNPIALLMKMGNTLLSVVTGTWIAAMALSLGIALPAGVCNSMNPSGMIFRTALSWMKSIVMFVTGLLMVPGAILSYYVPLYPFAVFTFSAIGWFILVVEGMAAAPLICLGVTHPEGHDFMGKAEQSLMLLLSIFLRPALIIIGLIAAMVVSFVAFRMLILAFHNISDSLLSGPLSGNFMLGVVNIAMMLIIFSTFTMELIEQCYKIVSGLPNAVMAWIGAPAQGADYSQMAAAIKSGASAGAAGVKDVASAATIGSGALEAHHGYKQAKVAQDAKDANKNSTSDTGPNAI